MNRVRVNRARNIKNAKHLNRLHWFDISLPHNMAKIGYNDSNGHNDTKAGFNTLGITGGRECICHAMFKWAAVKMHDV